ncbi:MULTISPECIES: MarR family winged helix-turn-helix transcriptional regulator [Thioclava]|uniref:MarR family winged helix-turn-helix transcriptional regulator n=1 Tax=Thioclava TaxID=285107 RepID=UPI001E62E259|nr:MULTISPECIES: MarR family transcriptional regulator [Thioclava]WGT51157.1 MarR family transcriptional regulator [Thioclava nitratireducens]
MPNEFETMPGHLIRRLNQRSTAVFQKRIKDAPLELTSVQFAALDALSREPGMDQAQLAARIAYDRATIGDVVKRLVQKGLVERTVSETDRRARSLHLSPKGAEALEGARPVVTRLQAEILEGLSEEEAAQFIVLARKAVAPQD